MEKLIDNLEARFYSSGRVAVVNTTAKLEEYSVRGIREAVHDLTDSRDKARNHILKSASILTLCGLTALTIAIKATNEPRDFLFAIAVGAVAAAIRSTDCFGLPQAIHDQKHYSRILEAFPADVLSLEEVSSKRNYLRLPL